MIAPKVTVSPDSLPDAISGKNYYAKIDISGGIGPVPFFPLKDFRPENSGLTIDVCEPDEEPVIYECLVVKGIPVIKGPIVLEIGGGTVGGGGRGRFSKTYIINVLE
ncbi:hypothetical protein S922_21285 [Salmonella enterica subsp. enterica]|nr:hypothetical protein [Salmonella enterica subsp. enterica]EAW9773964.1 hypothetical protein [Salmonella enterica]EBD9555973.1 hypothetical protein [Salmonella enterica]EHM6376767.1 hypothetical protein [Salmonella enterica]EHN6183643.1 hypothetical protein [Salmonella enterica]